MALRVCEECSSRFAVGLEGCPNCGGTDHHEQTGDDMPKISRAEGPTYKGILEPEHVDTDEEREDDGTGVPAEEVDRDEKLTGDGTGKAVPPVGERGPEPVTPVKATKVTEAREQ